MSLLASVVITTRNRRPDLKTALASVLSQDICEHLEIIVIDDASTDGTSQMVTDHFPSVRLHRSEVSQGLIVQRNRAARLSTAPLIFSIDDDACFSNPRIVTEIIRQFDSPLIGALAIPFIDVRQDPKLVRQQPPHFHGVFVAPSFIGTAHAVRRDLFLQLGGYRESLFHQGEESDYCLRLLAAGYVVRLGHSEPIHHFESVRRDFRRMDLHGRRNNILFGWHLAPTRLLPTYLAATTWNGLRHGLRVRRLATMMRGLLSGYTAIWKERSNRRPVSSSTFQLYRELVQRKAIPLSEVETRLPPRQPAPVAAPLVRTT